MDDNLKREFDAARLKHILFKAKLRTFLYGAGTNESPVRDPDVCALGQWINTVALPQFGYLPETQELNRLHRHLHQVANRLLDLHQAGQVEEAVQGLRETTTLTDQVLDLLNTIERNLRKESR
ncbi:CZB domain-containing protein [Hymenobacter sp. CRA2]|uniref:CZB domain-containing protein n=1 Tax=Hymenobacter sp. CRA2 TaxID=1955620 RepID=UPI0009902A62|nr:CZB domain-containing protein [Hymenobacter sp. CRA2]OON69150.1 hypothetical protein B0919_10615 [Hymenobacter sp. CRA2]